MKLSMSFGQRLSRLLWRTSLHPPTQALQLQIMPRCGQLSIHSLHLEDRRAFEWVQQLAGVTFSRMERLSILFSVHGVSCPVGCQYPLLRSLTLGRGTAQWASSILPSASSTLTSFSLKNMHTTHSLSLFDMFTALQSVPNLERLSLDEVAWSHSVPKDGIPAFVPLIKLAFLSLTSSDHIFEFIRPLQLPRLAELVIVDVSEDLGPVFASLAQKTTAIEILATGMWEDQCGMSSEEGLVTLLEKQRILKSLSLANAPVGHILVQRLPRLQGDRSTYGWICPQLARLELSMRFVSPHQVQMIVESRSAVGCRLDILTLIEWVECAFDIEFLGQSVGS